MDVSANRCKQPAQRMKNVNSCRHQCSYEGIVPVVAAFSSRSVVVVMLVLLVMLHSVQSEEFLTDGRFNSIAVDEQSGNVYVGAINTLYQLTSELAENKEVDTSIQGEPDNWNKVLAIDSDNQQLVTCGSLHDGHCQVRQLQDISSSTEYHQFINRLAVAANNAEDSTVAFVAPGPSNNAVLYVAATSVKGDTLREKAPAVSSRNLVGTVLQFAYDDTFDHGTFLTLDASLEPWESHNKIQYKAAFSIDGFSYFLTQQPTTFSAQPPATTTHLSKMIQICQQDQLYDSYVELPIRCDQGNDIFDLVKVAKTISPAYTLNSGEPIVVGLFTSVSAPSKTAVCIYKLDDIRQAFTDSIKDCYDGNGELTAQFTPGSCTSGDSSSIDADFCGNPASVKKSPLSGDHSLIGQASHVFEDTDISAIALDTVGEDTVAFLGTQHGHVKKVILPHDGQDTVSEFEDITVHDGSPVQDIIMASDADYFYVMTETKIVRLPRAECDGQNKCEDCSDLGNPYCGWCSLENKCSRRSECNKFEEDEHFLTYDETTCFELVDVSPSSASVDQEESVYLEISRLPAESGSNEYKCLFGTAQVDATVRNNGDLRCRTPAKDLLPQIADDTDHVEVPLKVKSTETNEIFLDTTFIFYDCKRHLWCSQCTQSEFRCQWCIYDNKCVDDDTSCAESVAVEDQKTDECPSLDVPSSHDVILIPAGHRTTVTFSGHNLPDLLQKYGIYQCLFKGLQSSEVVVTATRSGQNIICDENEYLYDQESSERYAEVRVKWNDDYFLQEETIDVTVYKCGKLGPDCSSCLSLDRGDSEKYQCRWCGQQCSYKDSCTEDIEVSCPGPIISEVIPLSAPTDGGSLVTIIGSNLGTQIEDIHNVTVAGQSCETESDLYEVSVRIVCKTEPVDDPLSGDVSVSVKTHDTVSFSGRFHYRDPKVDKVDPLLGSESGGTKLTITGKSFETGDEQLVMIGECNCTVNSLTDSRVVCTTARCDQGSHDVFMTFDGAPRVFKSRFTYTPDPTVTMIAPLKSFVSGGRILTVTGTDFKSVQNSVMRISGRLNKESDCTIKNAAMECASPAVDHDNDTTVDSYKVSFDMDGINVIPPDEYLYLEYFKDPTLTSLNQSSLTQTRLHQKGTTTLEIEGQDLDVASSKSDITVTIGDEDCPVKSVASGHIYCTPPDEQPGDGNVDPDVTVKIGNFEMTIGKLKYTTPDGGGQSTADWIIGVAVGGAVLMTIIIIILIIYKRKSTEAERQYKKMQIQLDTLESNVRNECKQAFAELQTEVTDFTSDINIIGIPFWDYRSYTFKVLFPSHTDHPVLHNSSDYYTTKYGSYDQGLHQFNQLINSKQFLLIFIRTLEQQRNFSIRDRAVVASLLMIVLQDKMEYATEIMKALLNELIDRSVEKKHPKLMLRRTESVVEKLLTNWLSLSMYGYLKKHAGKSLFMLCRAIKHQTEKGPVDAINCEAHYSLSEDRLLREKIQPITLTVQLVTDDGREPISCKVLDCDTITQAKEKALDAIYLNTPFSKRPSVYDVDLVLRSGSSEWRSGRSGHLSLQDEDVTTENLNGWKRCNTLLHYHVADGATMALVPKKNKNEMVRQVHGMVEITTASLSAVTPIITVEEGTKVWHLMKHDDGMNASREKKVISEIFLTRLLATKGTLQQFIDELFMTILKVDSSLPPAVKYLFDFLDLAARRHNIVDPDVVHTWKSNSLPLRFWVNIIKNPEFVFDIHKSHIVDSCLSVVAQTFMDSCSTSEHKLGKDSPSNKLLFAKDIPKYRGWVSRFYKGVQQTTPVSDAEITQVMTELSMTNNVDFNIAVALKELYKYATQYNFELLEALDDDPSAKKLHLANKFEQAVAVIEGKPLY